MDYSKLSDYEISCEVGRAISFADYLLARNEQKNYCNNPADAWPIIQESGICIGYDGICWDASCPFRNIKPVSDWREHPYKPFRMAMIVYLMMQESE